MFACAAGSRILTVALAFLLMLYTAPGKADSARGPVSGLPLPRFVSLSADTVNLRTGPGRRYPIAWVFQRRSMPVEVVGEYLQWFRIRDHEGVEGWVHRALLSGKRTAMVTGDERSLHRLPHAAAPLAARAEPGVQGRLISCRAEWCEMEVAQVRGWIRRSHVWGIYPEEVID